MTENAAVPLLQVQGLNAWYGAAQILFDVSLQVGRGEVVALMGRNHPLGVFLAALLFGFLYQGGAELALFSNIPRELITVIQALVILFTGALDNMVRMLIAPLFRGRS